MPVSKKSKRQKARHAFINEGGTPTRQGKFLRSLSLMDKKRKKARTVAQKKARKQREAQRQTEQMLRGERGVL